ncbi:hypothetical protein AB1Y20_021883 [Prymnesium parvum]|uniref:Zinc finger PHD-type domain-containing protein n=1 Tax=Prymnesium parvum TaxID=97485 RepID=A0AB34JHU1_PRYPA
MASPAGAHKESTGLSTSGAADSAGSSAAGKENLSSPSNGPAACPPCRRQVCEVCADGAEAHAMLVCTGCAARAHAECYGWPDGAHGWKCDACSACRGRDGALCALCGDGGGAMLRTAEGQWSHGVCALYVPAVAIVADAPNRRLLVRGVPAALERLACALPAGSGGMAAEERAEDAAVRCPKDERCLRPARHPGKCKLKRPHAQGGGAAAACALCARGGGVVRCAAAQCAVQLHPHCALRAGLRLGSHAHFGAEWYFVLCRGHSLEAAEHLPTHLPTHLPRGLVEAAAVSRGAAGGAPLEWQPGSYAMAHETKSAKLARLLDAERAQRKTTEQLEQFNDFISPHSMEAEIDSAPRLLQAVPAAVDRKLWDGANASGWRAFRRFPSSKYNWIYVAPNGRRLKTRTEAVAYSAVGVEKTNATYPKVRLIMSRGGAPAPRDDEVISSVVRTDGEVRRKKQQKAHRR